MKHPADGTQAAQSAANTKPQELVSLMKSSHSVKILAAEIEKFFISPLKGKPAHCGGCLSFGVGISLLPGFVSLCDAWEQ